MMREDHRIEFAHWIAACIGDRYLATLYFKPSVGNKIILAILKSCKRINALLGSHKWVFYCRYQTDREAQKAGWRRMDITEHWFINFDPKKGPFVYPYPRTGYCDLPAEVTLSYPLCRPLPVELFPRSGRSIQTPVPGSESYVKYKESGEKTNSKVVPEKCWSGVDESDEDSPGLIIPGSSRNNELAQGTSSVPSDSKYSYADDSDSDTWGGPKIYNTKPSDTDSEEDSNARKEPRDLGPIVPVDWDKPICPFHKIYCRKAICSYMHEHMKEQRRKQRAKERNERNSNGRGAWNKVQGSSRGGRGRGNGARGGYRGFGGNKGGWV
ncbi:hypothetical protein PNOK_0024100 [Pyrrhoderma noxium]|uniref:Uncharacterized protein n=1 Tax=Pyrrhoderma noxium TaxID=2282107 RepID=A0A286UUA9_9AGAM|nr:hypothetical protein PNOK_0024100 [Pyrrhoderma noxium]